MKLILFLFASAWTPWLTPPTQNAYSVRAISPGLLENAATVVRRDYNTLEIKSEGEATFERRLAVTYLSQPDESAFSLPLSDGSLHRVRDMRIALFDAEGRLVLENGKSEVKEYGDPNYHQFTDSRTRVLSVAPIKAPFTVEYSYKIDYRDFIHLPKWTVQLLGSATEHAEYHLVCPADYQFQWKGVRTEVQPVKNAAGTSWRWVARDLPAVPDEPSNPYPGGQYAYVVFAPEQFKVGEYRGSMGSWERFGEFMYRLNAGRDAISPALAERVRAMTADCGSESEKIAVLYRFLQENNRYVSVQLGIGGWQTFPAEYVEKKGYGDCKALSNYMQALLKAAGIDSWLALVYGDSDGAPEPTGDFPHPAAFNHMILYVPATDTWLECTSDRQPAGYLSSFTSDRQALLLTPAGGRLVRTPGLDAEVNSAVCKVSVALSEDGSAQIDYLGLLRGARHDWCRNLANERDVEERQRRFANATNYSISTLHRLSVSAAPDRPEAVLDFQLATPGYATRTGRRLFVPLTKFAPVATPKLPADTARVTDLALHDPFSRADTIRYLLPAQYALENAPGDVNLESEFGTYQLHIKSDAVNNEIIAIRRVVFLPVRAPAARYEEVRQFYRQVEQAESGQVVLVKRA